MQTILIPTDFKSEALNCIPELCEQFQGEELQLIFTHMFKLSDSIQDLLMLSRRSREYEYISDNFHQSLNRLKSECAVKSTRIEFFYGSTIGAFKNFLEANEVTYILDPVHCSVSALNKTSIAPDLLLKKCGTPTLSLAGRPPGTKRTPTTAVEDKVLAEA